MPICVLKRGDLCPLENEARLLHQNEVKLLTSPISATNDTNIQRPLLPDDSQHLRNKRKEPGLRTVPTNTEVFLRGLSLCGKADLSKGY